MDILNKGKFFVKNSKYFSGDLKIILFDLSNLK